MIELLLSIILSLTGIERDVSPELTAIAERRAVEVSTNFSHDGMDPCCYEVLAWNSGYEDPVTTAALGWRDSATHWQILSNPSLTEIGCGYYLSGDRHIFVCVLRQSTEVVLEVVKPTPTVAPTVLLPNTAMLNADSRVIRSLPLALYVIKD